MVANKLRKSLKRTYYRIKGAFQTGSSSSEGGFSKWKQNIELGRTKPQVFAYQLVGGRAARFFPLFEDLKSSLKMSGMKTNFKAYVSTAILASLLVSAVTMTAVFLLLSIFQFSFVLSLLFGVGIAMLAGAVTVIGFYAYPSYRADSLKRSLEDGLPFTASYMSVLAGAGVPPDFIWRSLAQADDSLAVSSTAKNVVRDVELFGFDIISSLETTSKRTPSERFKDLLEGFISIVHSGGDMGKYLRDRTQQYMTEKRLALKRFSDSLGVLAEFYVTLMVAGSLIFVIMLAVMSMLGGGGLGGLDTRLTLQILTYLGLPIGSVIFIIVIDMVSPKR